MKSTDMEFTIQEQCCEAPLVTDEERGELICPICGTVQKEKMPEIAKEERPSYSEEGDSRRTAPQGMASMISRNGKDAFERPLSPQVRRNVERLRQWDRRSPKTRFDEKLIRKFSYIESVCRKLGFNKRMTAQVVQYSRKAHKKGLFRGRSMETMILALVYIVSQEWSMMRMLQDVVKEGGGKRRQVRRAYKVVCDAFSIPTHLPDYIQLISRIAHELSLSERTCRRAIAICEKMREMRLTGGQNPSSIAAVCITLACKKKKQPVLREAIARTANISGVSLRNGLKRIAPYMKEIEMIR